MRRAAATMVLALVLAGCGRAPEGQTVIRFDSDGRVTSFRAEVARTLAQQGVGLSGRTSVPAGTGMLFVWRDVAPREFWMKDTLVPLDLVSIRAGRIVGIQQMERCRADPCPATTTPPADAALEVARGQAARAGLKVGALADASVLQ